MLARITGRLESLTMEAPARAVISPLGGGGGVGYEVLLPGYLAQRLLAASGSAELGAETGPVVTLCTLHYLESLNQGTSFLPRLIGFESARELAFFELLTSVKGLGNKRALRALATSPGAVARAIVERDARFLQGLPEIGPKLADLIVHELKSKAEGFMDLGFASGGDGGARGAEAGTKGRKGAKAKAEGAEGVGGAGGVGRGGAERATGVVEPRALGGAAAPGGVVREAVSALVALGETPIDAERMVARAVESARAGGGGSGAGATTAGELLALAYAARGR